MLHSRRHIVGKDSGFRLDFFDRQAVADDSLGHRLRRRRVQSLSVIGRFDGIPGRRGRVAQGVAHRARNYRVVHVESVAVVRVVVFPALRQNFRPSRNADDRLGADIGGDRGTHDCIIVTIEGDGGEDDKILSPPGIRIPV